MSCDCLLTFRQKDFLKCAPDRHCLVFRAAAIYESRQLADGLVSLQGQDGSLPHVADRQVKGTPLSIQSNIKDKNTDRGLTKVGQK